MKYASQWILSFLSIWQPACAMYWDAETYAHASMPQKAWSMEVISAYQFIGNERILDIGSGDGAISALLSKKIPQGKVLGIDISPEMIEYSKKTWNRPNLEFEILNVESATFNNQFEHVTLFFVLEWIPDKIGVIKKCYDSLVLGGRLWIVNPTSVPKALEYAAQLTMMNPIWQPYFKNFKLPVTYLNLQEAATILSHCGFFISHQVVRKKQLLFPSRESFHKTLVAEFAYAKAVPGELRDAFISDCIDRYVYIHPFDEHGRILCPYEIAFWIGIKTGALHH